MAWNPLTRRHPFPACLEGIVGDGSCAGPNVRQAAPRPVGNIKRPDRTRVFRVLPRRRMVEDEIKIDECRYGQYDLERGGYLLGHLPRRWLFGGFPPQMFQS